MTTLDRTGRRKEEDAEVIALWGVPGRNPALFECPARPGEGRLDRFARLLAGEWPRLAAGAAVLALVPLLAHQNTRPGDDGASVSERTLGAVPFVAEPGADGMSPGSPADAWSAAGTPRSGNLLSFIRTGETPRNAVSGTGKKENVDWLSAVKSAVRAAAPAAAKTRTLPTPSPKLAGALKGLIDRASGGSARSGAAPEAPRLSAPSSQGLLSALRVADSLPRPSGRAPRGTSQAGTASGSPLLARLPSSGRASAADSLRDAVSAFSPSAGGAAMAGAGPAVFDGARGPGANPAGAPKAPGESLEFARRKMEMEKEMDLKYAKRKYNEVGRQEMLDKVKAESAAKLTETVVGKLLDGAFGLAQKASRGEGGDGEGGEESAVAANERSKAARVELGRSVDGLGRTGNSLNQEASQIRAGRDRFLNQKMVPPIQSSGMKASQASQAIGAANGTLEEVGSALDGAIQNIGKANQATGRQIQALEDYSRAAERRIDSWQVEAFVPGAPVGGMLDVRSDAQNLLGSAGQWQQSAAQGVQAAGQTAAAAPKDLVPEQTQLSGALADSTVRKQVAEYGALPKGSERLATAGALVQSTNGKGRSTIAEHAKAAEMTGAARRLAESTFQQAGAVRDELKMFDMRLEMGAMRLGALSRTFQGQSASGDVAGANATAAVFDAEKGALLAELTGNAQKIPPVQKQLVKAEKKLGL